VSAALDGALVALHGTRALAEDLEEEAAAATGGGNGGSAGGSGSGGGGGGGDSKNKMIVVGDTELQAARRPPAGAFVGDYTAAQLQRLRWRRVRTPPRTRGNLRSARGAGSTYSPSGGRPEGPLLASEALAAVLAGWEARAVEIGRRKPAGPKKRSRAGVASLFAERPVGGGGTVILDVKRPQGAAAKNVTMEQVARAAARLAAEAGCGARCVLWTSDDEGARALAAAVAAVAESGGERPRVGYVASYSAPSSLRTGSRELVPRLEGVAQIAAVDSGALAAAAAAAAAAGPAGLGAAATFERAGQRLFSFVVDGGGALRASLAGGAHALVTDAPWAVSKVVAAWRRRCLEQAAA